MKVPAVPNVVSKIPADVNRRTPPLLPVTITLPLERTTTPVVYDQEAVNPLVPHPVVSRVPLAKKRRTGPVGEYVVQYTLSEESIAIPLHSS